MPRPGRSGHTFQFYDQSVKHYVIGRQSFFLPGYFPPSALAFHHAVEYLLKYGWLESEINRRFAGQATQQDLDALQKELQFGFGHSLVKIWPAFKATSSVELTHLDASVAELDRWELIRYPWFPAGPQARRPFLRTADRSELISHPPLDEYILCLEDVDRLFKESFTAIGLDAGFAYSHLLKGEALVAYERENYHRLIRTPESVTHETDL
jgi:hypothetical protein